MTQRQEWIDGMRTLLGVLERNEDIPLPIGSGETDWDALQFSLFYSPAAKAEMRTLIKAIGGKWDKDASSSFFTARTQVQGVHVSITAKRDEVCIKTVIGTESITKTVPDPEYMMAAPMVKVTEEKEIVEWDCSPLLADA